MSIRLGVNIDHVATIRNARAEHHPDPLLVAINALKFGANSITIHLREDRRHITDSDLKIISSKKKNSFKFRNCSKFSNVKNST